MPTYEYECTSCGRRFDVVQKFSDAVLTTCDECQGALRKLISAPGIVFKGGGFYKTDSRGGGDGAPASTPSSSD
jgi:putative FmdB family regulatory protein